MKIDMTEEDIKEGNFDEIPNILFTRKIPHMMFEYSKRIVKKISTYTALPLAGFNYYTSKNNNTVEISQNHIPKNERRSWIYVSEKFLDKTNMILASTIEVVPIWKKIKRIYYMDAFIYREFYEPAPVMVNMDIYEMDEVCEVIFHNYLVRKEVLYNTIRF
jgi:hypothetical protein